MKQYKIIYADPPWLYKDKSKSHGGGAESHYKCMSTEDIGNIKISTAKDAVLLMWCTCPQLKEGLKLIDLWGFTYKTVGFSWIKTNKSGTIFMGMGRHTRANLEICLLATKGKGLKRKDAGIHQVQLSQRLRHSEKPDLFRDLIVKLYGAEDMDKIELFARKKIDGWDAFGDEI